jgi:hypothetical protein
MVRLMGGDEMRLRDWGTNVRGFLPDWFDLFPYESVRAWSFERWWQEIKYRRTLQGHFKEVPPGGTYPLPELFDEKWGKNQLKLRFDNLSDKEFSVRIPAGFWLEKGASVKHLDGLDIHELLHKKDHPYSASFFDLLSKWILEAKAWDQDRTENPYSPLKGADLARCGKFVYLRVDLGFTNESISKSLISLINEYRREMGIKEPLRYKARPRPIGAASKSGEKHRIEQSDLDKWADARLLPYLDVTLWLAIGGEKKPTPGDWKLILFPDTGPEYAEEGAANRYQERPDELRNLAEWVFSDDFEGLMLATIENDRAKKQPFSREGL